MRLKDWEQKYSEILREFGYSREEDKESAIILNSILKDKFPLKKLREKIVNLTVFVIGSGPSLSSSIHVLKKYKNVTKIVADGTTRTLMENRIKPDIVVTDLDGDAKFLTKASKANAIMVVHSHGDNQTRLYLTAEFKYCVGTTEGKPFGKICNFGGFTDGDRCLFLARHFKAKKIILFGMDFGTKIGKHSRTRISDRKTKVRKLRKAKELLEWIASKNNSGLYTTSGSIKGFQNIGFSKLEQIVAS
ncbi:MAG: 6-hydroxymethylpterin diphosphokinase MptE-like protein [Nitrosopumilaceae archaeon]